MAPIWAPRCGTHRTTRAPRREAADEELAARRRANGRGAVLRLLEPAAGRAVKVVRVCRLMLARARLPFRGPVRLGFAPHRVVVAHQLRRSHLPQLPPTVALASAVVAARFPNGTGASFAKLPLRCTRVCIFGISLAGSARTLPNLYGYTPSPGRCQSVNVNKSPALRAVVG